MHDGTTAPGISELRRDLAAAYRLIALEGMDDSIYTHISARMPDGPDGEKRFLLNPYGLRFDEVTASNLVRINLDGRVLEGGPTVNLPGYVIHSAVHAARHDVHCVSCRDAQHKIV